MSRGAILAGDLGSMFCNWTPPNTHLLRIEGYG